MFVSRKKYLEVWDFCKYLQQDNDKLIHNNRRLRAENIALKTKLEIKEKRYEEDR